MAGFRITTYSAYAAINYRTVGIAMDDCRDL